MPEQAEVTPAPAATLAELRLDTAVEQPPSHRLGVMGWLCVGWLALIFGVAILAPVLPLSDPGQTFPELAREGPFQPDLIGEGHILGGDGTGHDMLAQVAVGARASLAVAVGAVLFGLVIGGALGLVAGYVGGRTDTVLTTLFNVLLSIPALVLAMSLIAVFASSDDPNLTDTRRMLVVIFAIGVVSVPILGRISRASALSWSERDFVKAAQVAGAKSRRIMVREVLPNVLPAMLSISLLGVAVAIVAEGSLSILGIGVMGTSWGNTINLNVDFLRTAPHGVLVPSAVIFFTVLSLNYLGDVVRARFDVRESVL